MIISISKEELSQLPAETFVGKIIVIDTPEKALEALDALNKTTLIGFDTETKPSFKKGQVNFVSLLQLYAGNICYLFRLNMIGMMQEIKDLLSNPDITKIGLSIHDDFHNLNKLSTIQPEGFIDLQAYVKDFNIQDNSLSKIYAILFGKRLSKGQRLTNWEASVLSESQQAYAALDAEACVRIYNFLSRGHFHPEKSIYQKPDPVLNPTKE